MTTNINSYILGASTVQNTNLHNNVFGNVSGTAVEGDTQFTLNVSGDLTGGGTVTLGTGGTLNISYTAPIETDPIYTASSWYNTPNNSSNWNTAFDWGNHGDQGYLTSIASFTTDDLNEGTGNLYHTTARVRSSISVSGDLSYNSTTGVISYTSPTIPTTVSSFTNDAGYLTSYTDTNDNDYADSLSFEVSTGVLTIGRTGTLNDLTVDLDGRYQLTGTFAETDTLDSVTSRGNTTSNNITVNDLLVSGDLTVSGTTTTVFSEATRINENILYLNEGGESTITNAVGNGTTVTFTANNTYSVGYTVDITGVTPSSFNLVDAYVTAADDTSFTVTSTVTDTYVSGGEAYGHAHVNVDLGWGGAYDDGTYAHAGFFRDATDGRFKVFDSYTVEPSASVDIDTSHASFNLADIQADMFYGNLTGSVTGTVSSIANHSTTNLSEGTNLYYTNARVDARIPTNVSAFTNDAGYITGYTDTNIYLSSASFNTSNGVLTLTKSDTNTVMVDLDGRFTDNVHADAMNQGVATTDSPNFVDVTATNFHGTATTAKYADLAEKYTTEIEHPVGTVMMVAASDDYETCPVQTLGYPIGVISEKPAFLMNEECDGQALALKGRVPVRVIGPVKKGEAVFVYENGTAGRQYNGAHIVGVALETNTDTGEKLVECVLKT